MMRRAALVALPSFVFAFAAFAAELPPGLEHLEGIKADAAAVVDAVRAFDKAETAAAEREAEEAETLAKEGKKEEAEAKQKGASGRIAGVRQAYEWVLAQHPKNARAHNYYGELMYDLFGEESVAVKEWNLAISLDANFSPPYNNLGIHYCHAGQYQMGFDAYEQALKLDPGHPDYMFNLAQAYLLYFPQVEEMKKWKKPKIYKEAMKLSRKAAEADPQDFELAQDYANNFYAAENFGVEADWVKAAKAWETARGLSRSDVERFYTWLNEGRVWKLAGNKAKAAKCFNEAIKLRPDEAVPRRLLEELEQAPEQVPRRRSFARPPASSSA